MATDALKIKLNKSQETAILTYANAAHQLLLNQFSVRSSLEEIDRAYMREQNWTDTQIRSRLANRAGDTHKIQDITVPVVMPQVQAALGYFANVFLTGYPIFGVAADPANEDAALQMETIIGENAIYAGWARQLMMFFRDGLKYNLHAVECEWQQKTVWTVEESLLAARGAAPKETLWEGNVLKRMDLYNTFWDPRVHPSEVHEYGEYAGYIEIMSRIRMKKWMNELFQTISPDIVIRALESSPPATGVSAAAMSPYAYYQPLINPFPVLNRQNMQTFDWMAWANNVMPATTGIRYGNVYEVTKLYGRIIPADFGFNVPERNTPQVWKFYIVNGSVVLYAERQPNIHNWIPIFFGQPLEDGLDYQTKSFATNVIDIQDISSSMLAGFMASKRRLVGDRVLYDPMRIRAKDINSDAPAAKIPVRPSAYGKPVNEAVYQFPYHDEATGSLMQGAERMIAFADVINGQNPAQRGQFVKGNKTLHEYDDVMGHGNDVNQTMAIMTEAQVFTPMKECIKLNILQFQQATTLFNRDKQQEVQVKPEDIRKTAVHFKVSDGLLPVDKEMSGDEFVAALQMFGSSPQVGSAYNLAPLTSYIFKMRGADLSPFEKSQLQMQFEQMQQSWQQVAMEAIKAGQPIPAQPQPTPQLQQELQAKQQTGGANPSPAVAALESTVGGIQ